MIRSNIVDIHITSKRHDDMCSIINFSTYFYLV